MGNIVAQGQAQLAGIDRVFFVEHRLVATWPVPLAGQLLTPHELIAPATFAQLEGTIYAGQLSTDASDTTQGTSFAQVLEGFYAGDSPDVLAQLELMQGRRYLVLARYYNGTIVAVGNQLSGLLFTSKYASGHKPSERKGYYWQFAAPTSTAAVYLTQPFFVPGLGLVTPGQAIAADPSSSAAGTVRFYKRGKLVAILKPGQSLDITSPFRIAYTIK